METKCIACELKNNSYPGRGIIVGTSQCGKKAVIGYFIMGRSVNSRNRVFVEQDGGIRTEAFDPAKLSDPSLVIYAPVRVIGNKTIVTNGDQTDTVYDGLVAGMSFEQALTQREFEPDAPNFTPRISGMITFDEDNFTYKMSILKSADAQGTACNRYNFAYNSLSGVGHFIHTYVCDGNPIPTFMGEPERIDIKGDIDEFTNTLWNALNDQNKISLYVRFVDLKTGEMENRMINKNA